MEFRRKMGRGVGREDGGVGRREGRWMGGGGREEGGFVAGSQLATQC